MPDWTAVARKSKNRGDYGERRIAKLLMEFTSKKFRKTPSSGGYNKQGGVQIAEHKFCGDVICDDSNFSFCIESKNRPNDFNLAALSVPSNAKFTEWWFQCLNDAQQVNLLGMLYFKLGGSSNVQVKNDYLAMTWRIAEYLGYPKRSPHVCLMSYSDPVIIKFKEKVKGVKKHIMRPVVVKLPDPVLISWALFVQHVNPTSLFKLPTWVEEENSKLRILEDSYGVLRRNKKT
jgi:hypothetical protein